LQENNLNETLSQVEQTLEKTDMLIKPYKDTNYVLGGVD